MRNLVVSILIPFILLFNSNSSFSFDFSHNLWFRNIYIAPRGQGVFSIGATEDERGYDSTIKMDELFFLTNSLWESLPKLEDLELDEIKVGLRPAIYDGYPVLGPLEKASSDIIKELLKIDARGGIIAIDKNANTSMPFNTDGMIRGSFTNKSELFVAIY